MATWAIGDVQGCYATLLRLIDRIDFDPVCDRLWFVGDLVNRGPESGPVLRFVRALGESAVVVLGNHDIHLLARFAGAPSKERDTLGTFLAEPDSGDVIEWVRRLPLLHAARIADTDYVMVHAGLEPAWGLHDARAAAAECEAMLRGPGWKKDVRALRSHSPPPAAAPLAALTRARMVDEHGRHVGYSGEPEHAPPGLQPWWVGSRVVDGGHTVVFGHWAALGLRRAPGLLSIDTGCVWGQALTAVCLDDGTTVSIPNLDPLPRTQRVHS